MGEHSSGDHETAGDEETEADISMGDAVYTEEGTLVGTIRGVKQDGLYVTTDDGMEALSSEHVRAGGTFGEAELMWRCTNCGEMGEIEDGLPDRCPECGIEKEDLMYWTED
jgi:rubrerythrin